MFGGAKKALLINQDARDVHVTGNIINGAKSGHAVWIRNWDSDKSAKNGCRPTWGMTLNSRHSVLESLI
jgi:hypothetical protein